jgi:hypothetical protein
MTTVTYDQVLALAKQLSPEDQMKLGVALTFQKSAIYLQLDPSVVEQIKGKSAADFIVEATIPHDQALQQMRAWAAGMDVIEEDVLEGEDWDDVLRGIDAARHSTRKLFPELQERQS